MKPVPPVIRVVGIKGISATRLELDDATRVKKTLSKRNVKALSKPIYNRLDERPTALHALITAIFMRCF